MTDFSDLIEGYYKFRGTEWLTERERWTELASGQSPKVMVIACSDSRVDPATIFGTHPGEVFVVRNVANLVPPYETGGGYHGVSAAVEFAVTKLKVAEIVVLGHGACGGVNAALTQSLAQSSHGDGGFVKDWITLLDGAREKVVAEHGTGAEGQTALEQECVRVSIANLQTFPFIQERVADGSLKIHGAVFAIADGKLKVLQDNDAFEAA
ncbi:carbonic anhydrase [Microvirga sp. SRT01]|jgi:carbonic anhydrase|uniref:Carbonic anhydrase n=1 Tax=Sphingomonas longa TaxID=2778730 RepID=A0ABS2D1W2_9SPHN|nr:MULTISPECIES: carbonic anhydrase [Alphaproteobacteria]MBM6574902.1 carbonic anhydrase [Sphingomonas sp. BT552]MBR7707954.1 carbonic anhydrase [Microvirga sp. SRT01]